MQLWPKKRSDSHVEYAALSSIWYLLIVKSDSHVEYAVIKNKKQKKNKKNTYTMIMGDIYDDDGDDGLCGR